MSRVILQDQFIPHKCKKAIHPKTTDMKKYPLIIILFFIIDFGFQSQPVFGQQVKTGLDVLLSEDFAPLKGKRVGLITNPTGVDHNLVSTIDLLYKAPGVRLVALYGPEHGVRGDYAAGDRVSSSVDLRTGLPVYSIYGNTRKPTPEMLKGIDVLVYDIQDIGSRSYTFISSLGLAMEAAAENNIEFVVLDRPNPLGGLKMEGCLVEPGFVSFVSQFPIPYVHGLTVGELAMYLNGEGLLANHIKCKLTVISMKGWKRSMYFEKTGLQWVPSSPHIPYANSPYFYPVSGILGELGVINEGVGYTLPFQLFGAGWINADSLADNLNHLKLPGLIFRPIHYKPFYGKEKDSAINGVQVHIADFEKAPLSLVQFYVLQECHKLWPAKNVFEMCNKSRISMFDKVCGTDKIRKEFSKDFEVQSIETLWRQDITPFKEKARKYFLYE
jgi:uncharacterized protein YbbC (DUF1343 family)